MISTAWAQEAIVNANPWIGVVFSYLPLFLILAVFWFLIIRPQNQQAKAHEAMLRSLKNGDRVQLSGGILGTVRKIGERTLKIEVDEGTQLTVVKGMIHSRVSEEDAAKIALDLGTAATKAKK